MSTEIEMMPRKEDWEDRFAAVRSNVKTLTPVAKEMARYIYSKKIDLVIVPGATAQTAAYMVKTAWIEDPLMSKRSLPKFFAFGKVEYLKGNIRVMGEEELATMLWERIGKQVKRVEGVKVFILEDCVHTGATIRKLKKALKKIGFERILSGALVTARNKNAAKEVNFKGKRTLLCPEFRGERNRELTRYLWDKRAFEAKTSLEKENIARTLKSIRAQKGSDPYAESLEKQMIKQRRRLLRCAKKERRNRRQATLNILGGRKAEIRLRARRLKH